MKRELLNIKGKILSISERINLPVDTKVILENKETKVAQIYHKSKDGDFYIDVGVYGRWSADCEGIIIYEIKS